MMTRPGIWNPGDEARLVAIAPKVVTSAHVLLTTVCYIADVIAVLLLQVRQQGGQGYVRRFLR